MSKRLRDTAFCEWAEECEEDRITPTLREAFEAGWAAAVDQLVDNEDDDEEE